jgi:hypothetical protein
MLNLYLKGKDPFEAKAVLIVDNILRLGKFLAANRDAYVDVALNRDHSICGLSDLERDKIDAGKSIAVNWVIHSSQQLNM